VQIANTTCDGRIVSVLEGGYQLGGECSSAFVKSVSAHVSALTRGAASSQKFNVTLSSAAMEHEQRVSSFLCEVSHHSNFYEVPR
jgi:acetoin utilization deacetylase AcuC-like enzyme